MERNTFANMCGAVSSAAAGVLCALVYLRLMRTERYGSVGLFTMLNRTGNRQRVNAWADGSFALKLFSLLTFGEGVREFERLILRHGSRAL
jgi:hypothetical protein